MPTPSVPSPEPSIARPSRRGRRPALAALAAAAVLVGLVACSPAPRSTADSIQPPPATTSATSSATSPLPGGNDPLKNGQPDSATDGLVLDVTNNSSHDLVWVSSGGKNQPANTPSQTIPAKGGTDRIIFRGTDIEIHPTWLVSGTEYSVFPGIGVPLIGDNLILCTTDEATAGTPVTFSHCSIEHGYNPEAQVTFTDS